MIKHRDGGDEAGPIEEGQDMSGRLPGKALLVAPRVAWLTLALFASCLIVWSTSFVALACGAWPTGVCVLLSSAATFAIFTPMHEASHRSVARNPFLNELVGHVSAFVLTVVFSPFRFLHLEHHKFTNERDADPDYWVVRGPGWLLPLRWASLFFGYARFYHPRVRTRPAAEQREAHVIVFLTLSIIAIAIWRGHARWMLLGWIVPAEVAGFFLAFAFDYLPHAPHQVSSRVDRFRATTVRSHAILTPLLLYQNYHLMHHLYPAMPFYRYAKAWRAQEAMLRAKGAIDHARSYAAG